MKKMNWEAARTSFISAQSNFDHPHYDDLMVPLYQTIENVNTVSKHNKYLVFLAMALSQMLPITMCSTLGMDITGIYFSFVDFNNRLGILKQ